MLYPVTMNFSHDVIAQRVFGLKSQDSCSINSTQYTNETKIVCTNLNYNTTYILLVLQRLVNCTDVTIPIYIVQCEFSHKKGSSEQVRVKTGAVCVSHMHAFYTSYHNCS